jgi:aldehyde dehydrogenase (NAD+)
MARSAEDTAGPGDDRYLRLCCWAITHAVRPEHAFRAAWHAVEQWHPLGILGLVTAFNFPVAVWSWNSALAAICGDTIIWKPSSYTPLTAVAVTHIANKVMADHGLSGIFNLAIGSGRDVGELLLNDPRVLLVSFTGSTSIGVHVSEAVARRFGRTILELGGNNGIIVSEATVSLARAICSAPWAPQAALHL